MQIIFHRNQYFDNKGQELQPGDFVLLNGDDTPKELYLTESGELGTDATNPAWIHRGWASPCEYGIYPLKPYDEVYKVNKVE